MSWKTKRILEWIEYSNTCKPTQITPPAMMVGKLLLIYDSNISEILKHCKEQYALDNYYSSFDDYWLLVEQDIMSSVIDYIISDP